MRRGGRSRWDANVPEQRNDWWQPVNNFSVHPWYQEPLPPNPFSENDQFQSAYHSDRSYHGHDAYYQPFMNNHNHHRNNWNNPRQHREKTDHCGGDNHSTDQSSNTVEKMSRGRSRQEPNCTKPNKSSPQDSRGMRRSNSNNRFQEPHVRKKSQSPRKKTMDKKVQNETSNGPESMKEDRSSRGMKDIPRNGGFQNGNHQTNSFHERRGPPTPGRGGCHGNGLLGPPPLGRGSGPGSTVPGRPPPGNWRNTSREEPENEINNWLQNSKTQQPLNNRSSPVTKDPLPGSEEARLNAIKADTNRIMQSLKQKKNVNLNELLSSGDESKGESQSGSKQKTFPQNLAQLELDASDMRAIGRANTEKANVVEGDSDDDIIEVSRPASPVCPIIDLEDTPTKDNCLNHEDSSDRETTEVMSPTFQLAEENETEQEEEYENNTLQSEMSCVIPAPSNFERLESNDGACSIAGTVCKLEAEPFNEVDLTKPVPKLPSKPTYETNHLKNVSSNGVSNQEYNTRPSQCLADSNSTQSGTENLQRNVVFSPSRSLNQRRIRTPSSCETPIFSGSPQQIRANPLECRSPPFFQNGIHDSRQKRIIKDLQKLDQRRLRDFINNPRSGKLDFAMKQLMKEHKAALSRRSRDVAEKQIPAEILQQKSQDLPTDDSCLLADFAIDWNSLPGELISTLGDLFQDFNSEAIMPPSGQILHPDDIQSAEPTSLDCVNEEISEPRYFPESVCDLEMPSTDKLSDKEKNTLNGAINSASEARSPRRIRVRQFAKENLFPSEDSSAEKSHQSRLDTSHSQCVDSSLAQPTESNFSNQVSRKSDDPCSSGDVSLSRNVDGHAVHNAHVRSERAKDLTQENSRTEDLVRTPVTPQSDAQVGSCGTNKKDTVSSENIPVGLHIQRKEKTGAAKPPHVNKTSSNKQKQKQKRFVHLEERTWFEDSSAERSTPLNTSPENDSNGNENNCTVNVTDVATTPAVNTDPNVSLADKQCISMLPVLMMTVPANSSADLACTMTLPEMVKRLNEIDNQLQNLVQERFIISQAVKAASEGNNEVVATVSSQEKPCNSQSSTINSRDDVEVPQNSGNTQKKRKLPNNEDKRSPKKGRKSADHSKAAASSSSILKGSDAKSSRSATIEGHGSKISKMGQKKKSEEVILDDTEDENNIEGVNEQAVNSETENLHLQHLKFTPFEGVKGLVLDIKVHEKKVYACSDNGLVYCISPNSEVCAFYGDKQSSRLIITCIALVCSQVERVSYLYTGCADGIFRMYKTQMSSKEEIQPVARFNVSSSVHCSEVNWGHVYLGTKDGRVIPFNLKDSFMKPPLCGGDHPILVIKACVEGPRKVLVVSCRFQPLAIRDADSGLLLRTIGEPNWTVYSIVLYKNLIICGSGSAQIKVYNFHNGDFEWELPSGKGVIDMRLSSCLLFCGCYDGRIYIYDVERKNLICSYDGPAPGKMVLCLCLLKKKVICSSKGSLLSVFRNPPEVKRFWRQNSANIRSQ